MPVNLRRFFINELSEEVKRQNGKADKDNTRPLSEMEKERFTSQTGQSRPSNQPKPFNNGNPRAPDVRGSMGNIPPGVIRGTNGP
jgi:hypothetical protein